MINMVEIFICASFIVLYHYFDSPSYNQIGQYIYVPYFLFCLMIIPQMKLILRSESFLKVSNYGEKLTILLLNIILLVFLGACVFNFAENNFGDNLAFVPKANVASVIIPFDEREN